MRSIPTALAALLVLLAGCTAGLSGDLGEDTAPAGVDGASASATGTVAFYLSDRPTAIGDFAHLNVTVTRIGFHPKGDDGTAGNGTPANDTGADASDGGFGDWIVEDVDDATVDLTGLVGDNATRIAGVELPAGEYNGVFVWVSEVEGTLTDGSHVEVKLPGERLKLETHVAVTSNSSIDFVFDIAVHETGSGRYVLRPVISQSGTDVPIERVEADGGPPANASGADDGSPENPGNASQGQGDGQGQGG